jgi:hypothetical protein
VAISEYTGSVSGVTVALDIVMALCPRSGPANKDTNKDTNKSPNNIVLLEMGKIMNAIIGRKGI